MSGGGDDGAWRPRFVDPDWHVLFRTTALEVDPLPEGLLQRFADYCETMYLDGGGNSLYPMRCWTAYRQHGRMPPEWVLHHIDDVFQRAWDLLNGPEATPSSDAIAKAFGLGRGSGHYTSLNREPSDALIGFAVMRQLRRHHGMKVESAITPGCREA